MEDRWRLFFALWPDDTIRAALTDRSEQLKRQHPTPGRWSSADRYHLTLHFIGDFAQSPNAWIERASAAATQVSTAPFELTLDQAGSFANRSVPWWLGPSRIPEPLRALWRELRDALAGSGVPFDTRLRLTPHLTLIYSAGRSLPLRPIPPVIWPISDFVLVLSHGGRYEIAGRWTLSADAGKRETDHARQLDLWDNPIID